ncbi:MAG: CRTAC1 family protein, partial [Pirellulaceae bacterium]|nr:CRTAC1 family protein [Pirellulaceae bacterium]
MQRNAKIHWSIPLALALVLAVSGYWWWSNSSTSQGGVSRETINTAIEAVAASENAKYDRALTLWDELLKSRPGDADLLLNQAVTVLKWIDETSGKLNSGLISDPAEQTKLQEELNAAFTKAETTIAEVAKLPSSDGRTALLQATFYQAKSRLVQPPDDAPLRELAAKRLVDALAKNPAQPLLACQLDDLVQADGGDDTELAKQCNDALYASWKVDPRNLYLINRAGESLLKSEDPRLKDLLLPSLESARPMLSMMKATIERIKPDTLLAKASTAIESGEWRQVQQPLRQWFNILKGTSGFRADVRLVKPDIMALLDTSFLNRFADSASGPKTTENNVAKVEYGSRTLSDTATVACWYDVDVDLDYDIVIAHGKQLQLYLTSAESGVASTMNQELELPFAPTGMLPVDLFEVDSPGRPRTSVAMQVQSNPGTPPQAGTLSKEQAAAAKRHFAYQDLLIWGDTGIAVVTYADSANGNPKLLSVLENVPGLSGLQQVAHVEPSDIDADGDLDLVIASQAKLVVLQNNGNRTFTDVSEFSSLPGPEVQIKSMFACDIDRDLDQDVLIANGPSGVGLLENILHSQFRFRELSGKAWDDLQACEGVIAADLDGNSSWDVFATGGNGTVGVFTSTPAMGQWIAGRSIPSTAIGTMLQLADLNNDTSLDLITASETGLQISWGNGTEWNAAESISQGKATLVVPMDADRDGDLELLSIIDGKAILHTAQKPVDGKYVGVRVRGIADNNGGGRINHYTVGSTLELWSDGRMQVREVRDPLTHFGIGKQQPKNLRIIFNNGLTQNATEIEANTLVEEVQELKGSCPFVYGWDGEKFQLITDLLWNAPLGLQFSRGEVLPDRRWEYLLLPGELVQPKDGHYELRITEELWEVAYFDHIALTAIDHPADIDVFTNEKVGPPSIAEPAVFTAQQKVFARAAIDSKGRDCLEKLAKIDRNFVQAFDELICQGLAEPHFVELDFGKLDPSQPWRLYLNGWMHPADTSLNIGMSQNPERVGPEPPSLWVVDQSGQWVCAQPFMGFPGGKPKSIVIDLKGVFQSDDHRLRIGNSQQLYWDQAFVAHDSNPANIQQSPLELQSAELHYRGFGKLMPRTNDQPHNYDYQDVNRSAKWSELQGPFTRFGDVRELLQADDDRMVVMVSGDEFIAKFSMPDRPLPEGWRRDFVMHNIGWDKDADLNTLTGDGSLPLPFKTMQSYPPPFDQAETAAEILRKNADHLTRKRQV